MIRRDHTCRCPVCGYRAGCATIDRLHAVERGVLLADFRTKAEVAVRTAVAVLFVEALAGLVFWSIGCANATDDSTGDRFSTGSDSGESEADAGRPVGPWNPPIDPPRSDGGSLPTADAGPDSARVVDAGVLPAEEAGTVDSGSFPEAGRDGSVPDGGDGGPDEADSGVVDAEVDLCSGLGGVVRDCSEDARCGGSAGWSGCSPPPCSGDPSGFFSSSEQSILLPADEDGQCERCSGGTVLRFLGEELPGWCSRVEAPAGARVLRWKRDDGTFEPICEKTSGGTCLVARSREKYVVLQPEGFSAGWIHVETIREERSGCPLSCP